MTFNQVVRGSNPRCLMCLRNFKLSRNASLEFFLIQINDNTKQWVSDSPYLHAFDGLDSVHCQMEESKLTEILKNI